MKTFFLIFIILLHLYCASEPPVKENTTDNYFALRDITLGKDNTLYLSVRSAYIEKDKIKEAFEEFQELHSENKIKRTYWKCKVILNSTLECTEELKIKDIADENLSK